MMELREHLLFPCRIIDSPNYDERPDPLDVSLIVIHNISLPPKIYGGSYIEDLFCNRLALNAHPYFSSLDGLKVSSHLVIDRLGEVTQYVPFNQRAWHAGVSCFEGREGCNDFSIGIELEGCDQESFTEAQYIVLLPIIRLLHEHYPKLKQNKIVGHQHIAPQRKTDPGPYFDWHRLSLEGLLCV